MSISEKAQVKLADVVERFKTGDVGPIAEVVKFTLPGDAPARNWTLNNRVLAYMTTGSMDARGYKQWKAVDRYVMGGQTAGYILGPNKYTVENDDGEKETYLAGFHSIPVYGYEQTDGDPLPEYQPKELPPLLGVAERFGLKVHFTATTATTLGAYRPGSEEILVGADDAGATFYHELAHAAHKRVVGSLGEIEKEHKETVAELSAAVLMEMYGEDYTGDAWAYIKHFNEDPIRAIAQAMREVQQVLDEIFSEATAVQAAA